MKKQKKKQVTCVMLHGRALYSFKRQVCVHRWHCKTGEHVWMKVSAGQLLGQISHCRTS